MPWRVSTHRVVDRVVAHRADGGHDDGGAAHVALPLGSVADHVLGLAVAGGHAGRSQAPRAVCGRVGDAGLEAVEHRRVVRDLGLAGVPPVRVLDVDDAAWRRDDVRFVGEIEAAVALVLAGDVQVERGRRADPRARLDRPPTALDVHVLPAQPAESEEVDVVRVPAPAGREADLRAVGETVVSGHLTVEVDVGPAAGNEAAVPVHVVVGGAVVGEPALERRVDRRRQDRSPLLVARLQRHGDGARRHGRYADHRRRAQEKPFHSS